MTNSSVQARVKSPNTVPLEIKLDYDRLYRIARETQDEFLSKSPYPHAAIDNFLPDDLLEQVIAEFPHPEAQLNWRRHYVEDTATDFIAQHNKLGFSDENKMGPTIKNLMRELRSASFLRFLEELTGVQNLIGDPYLIGAGIHQTLPGGLVGLHADFSTHSKLPLERRVNMILYLNKDWHNEWGGHLELWSRNMARCEVKVAPVANRIAIFKPMCDTWHGHPYPLACPEGNSRKSLANFYYTVDRPADYGPRHGTLWQKVPEASK